MVGVDKRVFPAAASQLAATNPDKLFSRVIDCFEGETEVSWHREGSAISVQHGNELYEALRRQPQSGDYITLIVPQAVRKGILCSKPVSFTNRTRSSIDDFIGKWLVKLESMGGNIGVGYIFPNPEWFNQMRCKFSQDGKDRRRALECPVIVSVSIPLNYMDTGLSSMACIVEVKPVALADEISEVCGKLLEDGTGRNPLPRLLCAYVSRYYVPRLRELVRW